MSLRTHTTDMVQPNESSASECNLCEGGIGDASLGKPDVLPPELANHEGFQRIWAENQDLRTALEQSNLMLRKRHSEMMEFQESQRKEREFITFKFGEAKNLVLRLSKERSLLQSHLEEVRKQLSDLTAKEGGHIENKQSKPEDTIVTVQGPPKKSHGEEEETTNTGLCTENLLGAVDRNLRTDQEFLKVLQETESRNVQLQQQIAELQNEIAELKGQMAESEKEAQKQLQCLKLQLEQLAEEKNSVKSQVTSLLGELNERQMSLEISKKEKGKVEERLRITLKEKNDLEMQEKQKVVQLDHWMMQVQNLESALKVQRQNASDEKRKLAQLQVAYQKIFQEYDTHIKMTMQQEKFSKDADIRIQELKQQLQEAEEALVAKQELIDKLKDEAEKQRSLIDTVPVLKAQAEIFRADFLAERKAREKLHSERESLQKQLEELLTGRLSNRAMIEEMRNRHYDNLHPSLPADLYPLPPSASFPPELEPMEFRCPKCQYKAPDMDTLQIHVMDCIQ
ncbi:hypothetical protein GDO86_015027 [Hymenochirus boettgeri]|uniref:NF-kappa-B essential modulator n=1 Tax=Hymenochirus boettgeri TaxID=247094 RepID=A0A8T2JX15_9PIPI|nr:hypothetical protein GDO86_015027 [Hymenochirus boettgeri]KAG8447758.1 hypothetical protein GDO86_015027 [Hymenochirus boettgeri]